MLLIAYKGEVRLTGKHIDDVSDDRLAIDMNQRLRDCVPSAAKSLPKTGHRNDNLHII
jgi:hypothetical protein